MVFPKTVRSLALVSVAASAISAMGVAGVAGVASAQDVETASGDPDTIVVRARKRDEAIEDVPASVTAITGDQAELLALQDVADYIRQTPGAILVASGPDYLSDIALRGQGGGRLGFSESATGIYRNGIFVAGGGFGGRTYSKIDFFDMAAMEVYRGPQGALYGRNAVGGAVNVRTRQPQLDEQTLDVTFGYTSTDRYLTQGVLNAPLSEKVALRVGGYYEDQQEGFHKRDAGEYVDYEDQYGARASLGAEFSDRAMGVLTVETSRSDTGGFSTVGQNLAIDPDPFTRVGTDTEDRVVIEQTSAFAEFSYEFNEMDFEFIGNYETRNADRGPADFDHFIGQNNPMIDIIDLQGEDFERFGAETRLQSSGSGRLQWLVGADILSYESDIYSTRIANLSGPFAGSPALRRQSFEDDPIENLTSYSLFGMIGFDLTEKLNITLEARVQTDDKEFTFERVDTDPLTDENIPFTEFDETWTRFLPTLSLTYEATDSTTIYGRVATGYRPGGFNPVPTIGFFDLTAYDPENVLSGEVGWKGDYRLGSTIIRPQLAVFYTDTDDVQQTSSLSATDSRFSLQNVGSSYLYGAEFELLTITPIGAGTWRNNLGLSGANGGFGDGTTIIFQGATVDLSENRVPRSRDYILNYNTSVRYPVTPKIDGVLSFSVQAEGGGYDNATNDRDSEHYELFDITGGLIGDHWRLSAYVKNVTDEVYRLVDVNNNRYHNNPRLYGVNLSFSL